MQRIENEAAPMAIAFAPSPPALQASDPDLQVPNLPPDHPAWARDALALSMRMKALLGTLKPLIIHVRTFWDHAVRTLRIAGRCIEVDPSGSYRIP